MRRSLVLFCVLFFCFSLSSQTFIMKVNGKRALARNTFQNVISATFDEITKLPSGNFLVRSYSKKAGMLDSMGKVIIDPNLYAELDYVTDSTTGQTFHILSKKRYSLVVDDHGKTMATIPATSVKQKWGSLLLITIWPGDSLFDNLYFKEYTNMNTRNGITDLKGNWLLQPSSVDIEFISPGCIKVFDYATQKFTLLDKKCQVILKDLEAYRKGRDLGDSLARLKQVAAFNKETAFLIDSLGKIVDTKPREKEKKKERLETFYESGKRGARKGETTVVPAKYSDVYFSVKYILALDQKKGLTDFYDLQGNLLATKAYIDVHSTNYQREWRNVDYLIGVKKDGLYLLNDKFEPASPKLSAFNNEKFYDSGDTMLFICEVKDKYGVIDQTGKVLIPFKYIDKPKIKKNVIEFRQVAKSSRHLSDFYTTQGELIASGVMGVHPMKMEPSKYFVFKMPENAIYGGKPIKAIFPLGMYEDFFEFPEYKMILAKEHDGLIVLNSRLEVVSKPYFKEVAAYTDSTFWATYPDLRVQLLTAKLRTVTPAYDQRESYANGKYNKVKLNSKYGIIDQSGKVLLQPEWDDVISVTEKVHAVSKDGSYYFTDSNFVVNKNIVAEAIDERWATGTLPIVYRSQGKWKLRGLENSLSGFDEIHAFGPANKIQAKQNGKWGVYDHGRKKWTIEPQFDSVVNIRLAYSPKKFYYTTQIDKWIYFIDSTKSIIGGEGYSAIDYANYGYEEGQTMYSAPEFLVSKGGNADSSLSHNLIGAKFSIVNGRGKKLNAVDADHVEFLWQTDDYGYPFAFGLLWNVGGSSKDFITEVPDSVDELVVEDGTEYYRKISTKPLYARKIIGGKFGLLSTNGNEILPVVYDDIKLLVEYGERGSRYISYSDSIRGRNQLRAQIYPILIKKDGKWGIADLSGKILQAPIYDSIFSASIGEERCLMVYSNKSYGYLDLYGKPLIPVEFSGEEMYFIKNSNEDFLLLFQKGGTVTTYTAICDSLEELNIDAEGNEIISKALRCDVQQALTGGKFGAFDVKKNKWVLEPIYDDMIYLEGEKHEETSVSGAHYKHLNRGIEPNMPVLIKKDGKWGVFYYDKGIFLKPEYDEIKFENEEIIAKLSGVEKRFTLDGKVK